MNVLKSILLIALALLSTNIKSQNKYGNLQLQVSPTTGVAANLPVSAIDKDLNDTTRLIIGPRGDVLFQDLYVSGTDGIHNSQFNNNSLEGLVDIYNLQGQKVSQVQSNDGLAIINEGEHLTKDGIYFARDENNKSIKFFFGNTPVRLGESLGNKFKSGFGDRNLYEILVDGRGREFDPFFYIDYVDVFEGENFEQITPSEYVEDKPTSVNIELLVNGNIPSDNSTVTFYLPDGAELTKNSRNGVFKFGSEDGIKSHPFDNFTRAYTVFLNPKNTRDTNRFEPKEYQLEVLGDSNAFVLNLENFPVPIVEFENLGDGFPLVREYDDGLKTMLSSGLTMDQKDHTLWMVNFFDKHLFHLSISGTRLYDGFGLNRDEEGLEVKSEGVAYDSSDDSFWVLNTVGTDKIHNVMKNGVYRHEKEISLESDGVKNGLGIAYDPTDSTLWIANYTDKTMHHYGTDGTNLKDGFRVGPEMEQMRGMCYDLRDNSLVVINTSGLYGNTTRISKLDKKTGTIIWHSNNLTQSVSDDLNAPDGLAYDDDGTFWLLGLSDRNVYHIKEKDD